MPAAFAKDIARTIRGNLKRFVAIVVITILGTCMFSGLKAGCDDLRAGADDFFDAQQLFDVRVISTLGITEDDVEALGDLEGVAHAEGGYTETTYTDVVGKHASVDVKALSADGTNEPLLLEGGLPETAGEVAVTSAYLADSGKSIGDSLQLEDAEDETTEVFDRCDYVIVGTVIDPMETNNAEGSMSFRSASSSDYSFFVLPDDVVAETFTVAYLRLEGASDLNCYSSAYAEMADDALDRVEEAAGERADIRTCQVIGEARAELADGEREAQESFDEAEQAFSDGQKEIDDGRVELADGQATLDASRQQLIDGQAEIDANRQTLQESQDQLDTGRQELEQNSATIEGLRGQLPGMRQELEKGQADYDAALPAAQEQIAQGRAWIEAVYQAACDKVNADFDANRDALLEKIMAENGCSEDEAIVILEQWRASALAEAEAEAAQQTAALSAQLDAAEQELADGAAELEAGWAGLAEAEEAVASYDAGKKTLEESQKQIDDGWAQLEAAQAEIDSGWAQLYSGQAELDAGAAELEEGQAELDEQRSDYEQEKADALAELADAREEVDGIEPAVWYIQDRSALSGYSSISSDADSIEALGTAFPIIFLVVAILVSLTAITRLVEEQRGLIGTYKSLGYAKHQVYAKYLIYALSACVVGGIIGNVFGFVLLPLFLFSVFDVMYVLPGYPIVFNAASGVLGVALFVVAIGGSALLACRSEIRQTPAELLRPKAPKFGSRIFLERIAPLWKRLSFLNKVTARNLFRYKKRFFMTVAGIMGCTALIVCGFVIKDSVALMAPQQYEAIEHYDILAVASADDLPAKADQLASDDRVEGMEEILMDSGEVNSDGKAVDVQIMVAPDGGSLEGYVTFEGVDGSPIQLGDEGIVLTGNAVDVLGLEEGSAVGLQDSTLDWHETEVSAVMRSYLGNYAYLTQTAYEQLFGEGSFQANGVLLHLREGVDGAAFADELSQDADYLSVVSTSELKDSFASSFALINTVVAVILAMAAALAFVVLFTLSTTNISERERELATIKVLGFRRREVHHYVNKETLILTGIGIVLGLIAGPPLGSLLLNSLNMPGIAFPNHIEWYSMVVCAVLPFVFALIVDAITNRTLDRIDMIGALKSVE